MAETSLVLSQIQTLFKQEGLAAPDCELGPETRLKEDLGLDSFDLVQLILLLNRHFKLELGSQWLTGAHLKNLDSLSSLVERSRNERSAP
ncbi:MAG: acyl carrier protein [Candidatus Sericytochromatia bacterium]